MTTDNSPSDEQPDRTHIVWHEQHILREDREALNGHQGCVVWFTGLSGCGKSTIANLVDQQLFARKIRSCVLDGDNIRHGLNASPERLIESGYEQPFAERFGLTFSADDRQENIRRIGSVAQLLASIGMVTLTAFVSPYRRDRDAVRDQLQAGGRADDFIEVFVDASLDVCESRDPKGLYKLARAGKIRGFTGIDDPYEPPLRPELKLDAGHRDPNHLAAQVVQYLDAHDKLTA